MKKKKTDKSYIYERDNRVCAYCGKALAYRQMSLDHIYPRSLGGPDDLFNLTLSCKTCNKFKKSRVPQDWEAWLVGLFKRAVEDERLPGAGLKLGRRELKALVRTVDRMERVGKLSVFQSPTHAFQVKHNKIVKISPIKR